MEQLIKYLEEHEAQSVIEKIQGREVSWEEFSQTKKLDELELASNPREKELCLKYLKSFRQKLELSGSKIIQDSIHGPIELHPLLVKIIDTPQFQRLRDIKQLGGVYYVFPGASHNRFEHSIGVCYLAGEFIDSLARHQPELGIDDCDILCVKIAALCHDMGHGPFSHLYQDLFIPKYHKEPWKHEKASIELMNYMVESNEGLEDEFQKFGLNWEEEREFIEELIIGEPKDGQNFKGREKSKYFLYEIVANKVNGVDVDKMDYLLRDSHGLGIKVDFDWKRYFSFSKVIISDKPPSSAGDVAPKRSAMICVRKKMITDIYELFHARDRLFRAAYQHKTKRAVEFMFLDVLKIANEVILIPGRNGAPVKISDAINDMEAYTKLTDSIFHVIAVSFDPKLKEAQKILQAINQRKLYMVIGQTFSNDRNDLKLKITPTQLTEEWGKAIVQLTQPKYPSLLIEEKLIKVEVVTFNHGLGNDNPLDKIVFFEKEHPDDIRNIKIKDMSSFFPKPSNEKQYRVYYMKHFPEAIKALRAGFDEYCKSSSGALKKQGRSLDDQQSESSSSSSTSSPSTPDWLN